MPKKRAIHTGAVLRLFWRHTLNHPWLLSFALFGIVLQELSSIISPLFMRGLLNLLATGQTSPAALHAGLSILVGYALVSLIGWLGGRSEMIFGFQLIGRVCATLGKEAYSNLMRHSYQFFANQFAGALTRKVGRFAGAYESLYYSGASVILEGVIYVAGVSIVLLTRSWVLGSIVMGWVVLFILLQWYLNRWQHPMRVVRAQADTDLTATLADSISNQNTVSLFAGHRYEEAKVGAAADHLRDSQLRSWNFNGIIYGVQGLLTNILNVGMLGAGVWLWSLGIITLGDVVLIQAYVFGIFNSVWQFGRQFNIIYNAIADASEMLEILQTPIEVADLPDAKPLAVGVGEVKFSDVQFYFQQKIPVLHDLMLSIPGGQKVALVGPSGAGKSTVTKLLLRLYDVGAGSITIDGQNIAEVTQDSLREAIAFVPQEPVLFHRSLMDNIRYGRRDATDEEVVAAAKKAHCHEFISKLPQGYNTLVGERGIKLSGGERQRVAIARAILKNAPILVLDEATSSLDSESEALIQDALAVLMQGKTVVVIAHRLSTIMKMDRIVVLEGGRIVADGTHQVLLQQGGLYAKLWSIQAGGFIGTPDEQDHTDADDEKTAELAVEESEQ